ncbi:uncharacterized protein LOC108477519 [Gossypium arboreum]|uniref:uncharacterized protein LOC108477519 n=1 Tax=Gossypium arboreum TaxID=29729 RepID=UPI00081958EC|nr:uncharacterized protein LOC108477519 [Gossypium arboreum]
MQAIGVSTIGQAKGGNGMGCGRGAPGRGEGHSEARQPRLVYAAYRREDGDTPDVITGTFFIHNIPYTALIDIESTHPYIECSVSDTLGIMVENTMSEVTVLSLLRQSVRVNKFFKDLPLEANLDCAAKRVKLRTKKGDEGCEAYLAYVSASSSKISSVKDIRIVKDFPDVFPDELPGLPSNCEVEFGIKLLPGIAQVSISPYKMAPKELEELKA